MSHNPLNNLPGNSLDKKQCARVFLLWQNTRYLSICRPMPKPVVFPLLWCYVSCELGFSFSCEMLFDESEKTRYVDGFAFGWMVCSVVSPDCLLCWP
jgi:hypothetical protein